MTTEPYDYPLIEYTLLNSKEENDNERGTNLPRDLKKNNYKVINRLRLQSYNCARLTLKSLTPAQWLQK